MKRTIIVLIGFYFSVSLYAQIKPKAATAPIVKQPQTVMTGNNSGTKQQVSATTVVKVPMPVTLNEKLVFYKWKATRWVSNDLWNGPLNEPFNFNTNGTMSCSDYFMPVLSNNQLITGTYTVSGNNLTITLKKDSVAIMTCNIVYDDATQKFNGSYSNTLLSEYNAGITSTGTMKVEMTQ